MIISYSNPLPSSVPAEAGSDPPPRLLLQEAQSELVPGGDPPWRPGEGVPGGSLLPGGGGRDLPDHGEDGEEVGGNHVTVKC